MSSLKSHRAQWTTVIALPMVIYFFLPGVVSSVASEFKDRLGLGVDAYEFIWFKLLAPQAAIGERFPFYNTVWGVQEECTTRFIRWVCP